MEKETRIAVLIDAENVSNKYVKLIMDEVSNYGIATYKRVYGDFSASSVQGWMNSLQEYALTPQLQCNYTQGKSASDSALIIDAMDILYSGNVNGFCLVSSDSDFTKLAMRLKEAGMYVIGMGEEKTPKSLVSACESFKFLDLLYKEDSLENKEHPVETKNDNTNIPSKTDIEREVISIIQSNAEDDGWTNISEVGVNLSKRVPGFDPRNYKCNKLTTLLKTFRTIEIKSVNNPHNNLIKIVYARVKEGNKKSR